MTDNGLTLTGAKGMGGLVAQGGFDYQTWDALIRLPFWLRTPVFEGLGVEVLEDMEARFFAPLAPHSYFIDRYQAKSGSLSPAEVVAVLRSFKDFDVAHPGVARAQVLVTPLLPPRLQWIASDTNRVRRARPFYRPFPKILAASDEKLRKDLVSQLGAELGEFVATNVEVAPHNWPDRASAEAAFSAALNDAFPTVDTPAQKSRQAFAALYDLVNASRGTMLTRRTLLGVVEATLGSALIMDRSLRLHIRSDTGAEVTDALEIDASAFAGISGTYPDPTRWRAEVVEPLERSARWAREQDYIRILLEGSYRLSTALAVGWAFRSAAGFEFEIPTKSGPWATDRHPTAGEHPPWAISLPQGLAGDRLVVAVGVLRNPAPDVVRIIANATGEQVLVATLAQALTVAAQPDRWGSRQSG